MLKLSEQQIIDNINNGLLFEAEINDGSFAIKISAFSPVVCTAIHAGHRLRAGLTSKCLLSENDRLYEEDPFTEQFIQAMPITLIGLDSRYEYDLNRPIANCIYSKAWGKTVWRSKLTQKEKQQSINKHQTFYRILDALISYLDKRYRASLVIDVHSYNHLRRNDETPTFNLGTEQINLERWQPVTKQILTKLSNIELPNSPVTAKENAAFYGRGYMIAHINSRFQNTLVLPLEIKKVFMNELTGEPYPLVIQALSQGFKSCVVEIATNFLHRYAAHKKNSKRNILATLKEPAIIRVDRSLFQIAKGLETLHYINPINIPTERKRFFKHHGNYQPDFHYRQLDMNPFDFTKQLYALPVESIRDPSIQSLYRDVIDGLSQKIDLLVKSGQPGFLYESLKYYGEPSQIDLQNAHFLLHAQEIHEEPQSCISTEQLDQKMRQAAAAWDMPCKIETSSKLAASAMVSNNRKTVILAKNLNLTLVEAQALIHHELGVHMATTLNAANQRLKIFSLGLPGNTLTQEGLAILNEYQSGNIDVKRLHGLALRVLAVREMLLHNDFRHTYGFLHEGYKLSPDQAFNLAVRVHRGGGFTKDYLYLKGVSQALALHQVEDISNLYVGKTGFEYLPVINEMIERNLISAPRYYPNYLTQPVSLAPELRYLMQCIRPNQKTTIAA